MSSSLHDALHAAPPMRSFGDWTLTPSRPSTGDDLVRTAAHAGRLLPADVHDALVDFADAPDRSGALVLTGVPIGEVPATPPSPTSPTGKDLVSELVLLTVARRLGQPVGYLPEHGGDIVQNIVPVPTSTHRQVSTSSKVELMFHTEAAFHPHRPRYLLLLCLRGDPAAQTTLSSAHEVLPHLADDLVDVLFQPRFRTAVDESYLNGRQNVLGAPIPVLSGDRERPSMVFDADLMMGIDAEADHAIQVLARAVADVHTSI
ncbi:MAG: TauD/TfdA family dioxygenase, partial [Actinobacteria bacterium]|nr:TauD/TfdA family dioxygenase [Actinomycetota bacterium]